MRCASAALLLLLGVVAPERRGARAFDCKTVVTEGYDAILTRAPDPDGLKMKVDSCEKKTPWPKTAGPMEGRPWSPAGMVYEMRTSEEYETGKKLRPDREKGGCRNCKLSATGLGGVYCTASALPPDDSITLNCVLQSSATECCESPEFGWGWMFILLLLLGGGFYAGGGIAYNVKTTGAAPGVEALPHQEHWQNVYALVQDGAAFSKRRVVQSRAAGLITKLTGKKLGGAGAYSPLPKAAAPATGSPGADADGGAAGGAEAAAAGGTSPSGRVVSPSDWAAATGDEADMFGGGDSSSGSGSGSGSDTDDDIIE